MAQDNNGIFSDEHSKITVRERLSKYLVYWPLFIVCISITVTAGIVYSRYTVPKYMATTSFLVKGSEGGTNNSNDLIESALSGKREVNLNNEMMLIRSFSLLKRTVVRNGFNVSYFKKGRLLDLDIYKEAPFTLTANQSNNHNKTFVLRIKNLHTVGGTFLFGPHKAEKLYTFKWNQPFNIEGEYFVLTPKKAIGIEEGEYIIRWQPIITAAEEISMDLGIKAYDTKTSVIQLTVKSENLQKGQDILNALFAEFNLSDIEDRNKLSTSTVQFIDERLLAISQELKGVEGNLENYQGSKQLVDIKGQSAQSLENLNIVSRTIRDLAVQQGVVEMILDYFQNPVNSSKLVPSSLGLNDGTLSSLITQYNDLQLKKERETPQLATNSTVMQDLNNQIGSLKGSILESLNNISKNLQLRENNFQQQNSQYQGFLSSIPHNERVLQEIRRKQSITEGLYLYLLQKREETAISSTASNVPHYKQIDPASGYGPVEPNTKNIIMYTALLGLFLAFSFIYVSDLLNDKISTKEDITRKVKLPLIAQISHIPKKNLQVISVLGRNLAGEEFRALRTKLSYVLKNKSEKIILVTSSLSNEGKSFVSLNLAAVCAIPGKKVALLEFDIRRPSVANNLHLESSMGITDFLSGEVNNLSEIFYELKEIPTLHVFPAGLVSLNPADLLLSENMNKFFMILKKEYDFIIIDSPPVGLVSDGFILGQYCDMVLFIMRQRSTLKSQLEVINDISINGNLQNIHLILNDVKSRGQNGYAYGNNYNDPVNKVDLKKSKKSIIKLSGLI